ncbi:MAG: hypothetical protein ACFCVK_12060 [Acidimicrobiales bacterium]
MLEPHHAGGARRPIPVTARARLAGGLGALALLAAACGGGGDLDAGDRSIAPPAEDTGPQEPPAAARSTAVTGATAAPGSAAGDGGGEPDPAAEHLFPDVDVVAVADGGALNLAVELGGGDRPVLLWFWAPH